ncbi:MAG: 2-amino-4-hydroxy-6-hydroxymethyldihydropteridine diphosphokinase [Sphingomonadaceae bacterium]
MILPKPPPSRYAVALGSNRRHVRHGAPADVVRAAAKAVADRGPKLLALSDILRNPAMGPAGRGFANAAALFESPLAPDNFFDLLLAVERDFGRRRGRKWGPRVIDLDIILWSGGMWAPRDGKSRGLVIPHPAFRARAFVLGPLSEIAPAMRDPVTGLSVRQLRFRHSGRRPRPG